MIWQWQIVDVNYFRYSLDFQPEQLNYDRERWSRSYCTNFMLTPVSTPSFILLFIFDLYQTLSIVESRVKKRAINRLSQNLRKAIFWIKICMLGGGVSIYFNQGSSNLFENHSKAHS